MTYYYVVIKDREAFGTLWIYKGTLKEFWRHAKLESVGSGGRRRCYMWSWNKAVTQDRERFAKV